jgi:hypothetical protein
MGNAGQAIGGIFSGMGQALPAATQTLTNEARARREEAMALPINMANQAVAEEKMRQLTRDNELIPVDQFRNTHPTGDLILNIATMNGVYDGKSPTVRRGDLNKSFDYISTKGAVPFYGMAEENRNKMKSQVDLAYKQLKEGHDQLANIGKEAQLMKSSPELLDYKIEEGIASLDKKRQNIIKSLEPVADYHEKMSGQLKTLDDSMPVLQEMALPEIVKGFPLEKQDIARELITNGIVRNGVREKVGPKELYHLVDQVAQQQANEALGNKPKELYIMNKDDKNSSAILVSAKPGEDAISVAKRYGVINPEKYIFSQKGEPESFKAKNVVGRGWASKRPVMQDSSTGEYIYADSFDKGIREKATSDDTAMLRPVHIKSIDAGQSVDLAGMKNTYDRLGDVAVRAEKMKDKFGPISGRWTKLKAKFMNDGDTQYAMNEIRSMITIAYQLSGKQISVQEMKMLEEALLPTLEQPHENFSATLKFARDWVARTHDDRISYFNQLGFDVPVKPILGSNQGYDKTDGSGKNKKQSSTPKSSNPFDNK